MCLYCAPIHCTPSPKQNSDKSYSQHFYTLINGHKEQKTTGGDCSTKVHRDPGPLSSFVPKNSEVREQLLLAARDIWDGPFHLKQSLELWVCRLQGCRGEEEEQEGEEGGCIQNERHTLPDQRGADSPFILQISSRGGWGRVLKWRRKPLKLTWVTSVTAQRSPRGLPYGCRRIICSRITERNPTRANSNASFAPCSTQRQHISGFLLAVEVLSLTQCLN